jgi:predicted CXXCH cytochrome family protein
MGGFAPMRKPGSAAVATLSALALWIAAAVHGGGDDPQRLNPAAWGSDHVGKPVPEFTAGDECLFCHREIGKTWSANRHNQTIRLAEGTAALAALKTSDAAECAAAVQFVLGHQQRQRFLKSGKAYGQLDLLSVEWVPPRQGQPGRLESVERPHWDGTHFADACAGCHTTAVDPKTRAFAAIALDCFVCHGDVPAEHAKKPQLAYLSPQRKDEARVVASICAQCHIRTGTSKETGRPYPTNFVAGDNLFRDYRVDFSNEALNTLSTADRHVLDNVRDIVVFGKNEVTCLSCHDVHTGSSKKHRRVEWSNACLTCHHAEGSMRIRKPFTNFSKRCGY